MSVAVFYPCRPYCTDEEVTKDIVSNNVGSLYPVLNYPPQDPTLSKLTDFLRLLHEPSIETLMVWRGGRVENDGSLWKTSLALLKELSISDWVQIKKYSKNIIGCSDATYLLCALVSHRINCFYGPNYNSTLQCSDNDELITTLKYLSLALDSKNDYVVDFNDEKLTAGQHTPWTISDGIATGRLIGGNLDTICSILKSSEQKHIFTPQQGDILFLEENDPTYNFYNEKMTGSMYDNLMFLKSVGIFSKISGLILGRSKTPTIFDPNNNLFGYPADNLQEKKYVETVVLLSQQKPKMTIDVTVDLSDYPPTKAEAGATYQEIKEYVSDNFGLNISTLNISQVKREHGIIERDNYNKGKDGHRVPKCPPEKRKAIEKALEYYKMI